MLDITSTSRLSNQLRLFPNNLLDLFIFSIVSGASRSVIKVDIFGDVILRRLGRITQALNLFPEQEF